ncbi:TonB-dependent receptor [Parahaliea sp. F7430]|uniref:TonB-dependent receptor n=1 Tax=Sediminihaliea albiluteola TaxID=2758564 RepID=A0A7W2TU12_9GAMM|nr:TonB-dependent receptor [Sediminihaliea albiluteola]MBA6411960.1 TonB-dependent receptor [Sediminihaliea albiluteola]
MNNKSLPSRKTPLAATLASLRWSVGAIALSGVISSTLVGQVQAQETRRGTAALMLEEVIVTARKRVEGSQDVPMAISAFGSEQLEALKVRDLNDLSVSMPNVALDDVGTIRGTANFSIRGLGINSSIPGIDPTVGLIIDGVYMGTNGGVVFDTFDIESIEVLRGPQGTLFGRNVTGGAVLMNTKRPSDELEVTVRAAVDKGPQGGLNQYLMGSVGGPVSDWMSAKLTAYLNDDDGFVDNKFDGQEIGAIRQKMFRPVVVLTPSDDVIVTLRYEHTDIKGDGPVSQSHVNGSGVAPAYYESKRDKFNVSIDEKGSQDSETNSFTAEVNWDIGFGNGTITNIFGWRDNEALSRSDIDSQPVWLFHAPAWIETEQYSNELRYNGLFADKAHVTVGAYWFTNDIAYHERRELAGIATGGVAPGAQFDGGGIMKVDTRAIFGQVDYDLDETWTLTAGLRYSEEDKEAKIASLSKNINSPCNIVTTGDCFYDFRDDDSWNSLSPKVGVTYNLSDEAHLYSHWSKATRSGGYNMRNTSFDPADTPGPFDQETVTSFEVGYKSSFGRGKLNVAAFYNEVDDMQREINLPGPIGVIQLIRNTAEATILGLEIDGTYAITDSLVGFASLGVLDPKYDKVTYDLNGDGVINSLDKKLDMPRAAELTYTLGLNHDLSIADLGYLTSRISYSYRDKSYFTDNNLGEIDEQKILNLGFDFHTAGGHWVFSIYGDNLLNTVKQGGDTQLPDDIAGIPLGGAFSPLTAGRRVGLEVTYKL